RWWVTYLYLFSLVTDISFWSLSIAYWMTMCSFQIFIQQMHTISPELFGPTQRDYDKMTARLITHFTCFPNESFFYQLKFKRTWLDICGNVMISTPGLTPLTRFFITPNYDEEENDELLQRYQRPFFFPPNEYSLFHNTTDMLKCIVSSLDP